MSPRCAPCGGPTRGTDSGRPLPPASRRSRRPRGPWTGCCPPPPPAGPSRAPSTGPGRPAHPQRPVQSPAAPGSAPAEAAGLRPPGPGSRTDGPPCYPEEHERCRGRTASTPIRAICCCPARGPRPGARCGRPAPRRRVTRALPARRAVRGRRGRTAPPWPAGRGRRRPGRGRPGGQARQAGRPAGHGRVRRRPASFELLSALMADASQ